MGHAFGLKHGHDRPAPATARSPPEVNDNEFSRDDLRELPRLAHRHRHSKARLGSAPQSFMMYDIAALQALYGANFSKANTSAVYRWDAVTRARRKINGMRGRPTPA